MSVTNLYLAAAMLLLLSFGGCRSHSRRVVSISDTSDSTALTHRSSLNLLEVRDSAFTATSLLADSIVVVILPDSSAVAPAGKHGVKMIFHRPQLSVDRTSRRSLTGASASAIADSVASHHASSETVAVAPSSPSSPGWFQRIWPIIAVAVLMLAVLRFRK